MQEEEKQRLDQKTDPHLHLELVNNITGEKKIIGGINVHDFDTFDVMEEEVVNIGEKGKELLIEEGIKKNKKFWWERLWKKIKTWFGMGKLSSISKEKQL